MGRDDPDGAGVAGGASIRVIESESIGIIEIESIGVTESADARSISATSDAIAELKPAPTYRYTCGYAEGDARYRCSGGELDEIRCDTGTCPKHMMCFVVLCTETRVQEVKESSSKVSFSKTGQCYVRELVLHGKVL